MKSLPSSVRSVRVGLRVRFASSLVDLRTELLPFGRRRRVFACVETRGRRPTWSTALLAFIMVWVG